MQKEMPFAVQIPLLHLAARSENPHGLRVPQSGWLHEPKPGKPDQATITEPVRNTYKRSHRWARVLRDEDEIALIQREEQGFCTSCSAPFRRPGPVRQADGSKRADLDSRLSTATRWAKRQPGRNQKKPLASWSRVVFSVIDFYFRHASRMP